MARKGRWLGLLATCRELTPDERRIVDRALENDPQARDLSRRFEEQDALLATLHRPKVGPAVTEGVMAATVAPDRAAPRLTWRPVLAAAMALLLLVMVGGTGVASSGSLPGDPLYPVKRAGEEVRVVLTLRDQQRAWYLERLGEIRRQEVNALLELGRAGIPVEFEGPLEHSDAGEWLVAGVPIVLPEDANGEPHGLAGAAVHVFGQVEQAQVRVQRMRPITPSGVTLPLPAELLPEPQSPEPVDAARPQEPPARDPASEPPRADAPPQDQPPPPPTEVPPAPPAPKDDGSDTPQDQPSGTVPPAKPEAPKQDGDRQTPTPPDPGRGEDADGRSEGKGVQDAPPTNGDGERPSAPRDGNARPPNGIPEPTRRPSNGGPPAWRQRRAQPPAGLSLPVQNPEQPAGPPACGPSPAIPTPNEDAQPRGR